MSLGHFIIYLLSRSIQNKKLVFAQRSLVYVLLEKQVVDLDVIKIYSRLQHETIKKSWIQAKGTAGLLL